ncbi:MAG: hypothetical protein IT288_14695 [Bdellovibrionales bacterium]|nr:hypothetical protein [Bdellovibrionales bacterium]
MVGESQGHSPIFYFNARDIGESLEEVAVDIIKTESQNITSRWLHSAKEADLFIWKDEKENIIKQQMSFCGQIVEWNILEGIKTGVVLEDENEPSGVEGSEVVRFDEDPQVASVKQAIEVLRHVLALTETDREILLTNFNKAPVAHHLAPEEFLRRYGPNSPKSPQSWWARLKHWFSTKF